MPANMLIEAHCQEERGINAEAWLSKSGQVAQWKLEYSFDSNPTINREEVIDWKWVDIEILKNDIKKHSNLYTFMV